MAWSLGLWGKRLSREAQRALRYFKLSTVPQQVPQWPPWEILRTPVPPCPGWCEDPSREWLGGLAWLDVVCCGCWGSWGSGDRERFGRWFQLLRGKDGSIE